MKTLLEYVMSGKFKELTKKEHRTVSEVLEKANKDAFFPDCRTDKEKEASPAWRRWYAEYQQGMAHMVAGNYGQEAAKRYAERVQS